MHGREKDGKMRQSKWKAALLAGCALWLLGGTPTAQAETQTVEAEGSYAVGDGPDENITTAKERARQEALRAATEKAGVYVESYSEMHEHVITKDEVRVIARQILQVQTMDVEPVVDGKIIRFVCHVKAVFDPEQVDWKTLLQSQEAIDHAAALQKQIDELQAENERLKAEYQKAGTKEKEKKVSEAIQKNEEEFMDKAYTMVPIIQGSEMTVKLDLKSVRYDKKHQAIDYTLDLNARNGGIYFEEATHVYQHMRLFTSNNSEVYLGSDYYRKDGSLISSKEGAVHHAKGKLKGKWYRIDYIVPYNYNGLIQQKIYNYLDIPLNNLANPPKWRYLSDGGPSVHGSYDRTGYKYYLDENNIDYAPKGYYDIVNPKFDFDPAQYPTYDMKLIIRESSPYDNGWGTEIYHTVFYNFKDDYARYDGHAPTRIGVGGELRVYPFGRGVDWRAKKLYEEHLANNS